MKKNMAFVSLVGLASLVGCAPTPGVSLTSASSSASLTSSAGDSPYVPAGYALTWSDEFDGDEVSTDDWTLVNAGGGFGNHEAQFYDPDNAGVQNGELTLTAQADTSHAGSAYTSAKLTSQRKISTAYGYVEARISLPAVPGMWPAFWMLPENGSWPVGGEIDIMEAKGRSAWGTSGALHHASSSGAHIYEYGGNAYSQRYGESDITAYHTYAIEWTEEAINWYADGKNFLSVPARTWHPENSPIYQSGDPAEPFNVPFYLILNLAVGGDFDGGVLPPEDFVSSAMKIDYVRLYEEAQ